jgi:hypothetical protein
MPPALDHPPALEHQDLVGVAHRGEAVGDDEARGAARAQARLDARFRRGVEGARRLVEDEDRGIAHQRPRDLESLALPAAQVARALLQRRIEAARARGDLLVERRVAQRARQRLVGACVQSVRFSRTLPSNSTTSWSTYATARASSSRANAVRGLPSTRISPLHGSYSPTASRASVDFPDPDAPTSATRWPGASVSEKFSSSGGSLRLYPNVTLRNQIGVRPRFR